MNTITLLTLSLGQKRDLILARQRSRQLAALLHFSVLEQAAISAAVFSLADQLSQHHERVRVTFQIAGDFWEIHLEGESPSPGTAGETGGPLAANCKPEGPWHLRKKIPPQEQNLGREDLVWAAQQIHLHTPSSLFAEIQRQNQELLQALQELRTCQEQLAHLQEQMEGTKAA